MKKRLFTGLFALILLGCSPAPRLDYNAQKFCQSLNAGNFEACKVLYSAQQQQQLTAAMFSALLPSNCRMESFSLPYATVLYTPRNEAEQTASLYLYPSGTIKYDPIFFRHPALDLRSFAKQLEHEDIIYRQAAYTRLTAWKIPTFDYDPKINPSTQRESLEKIHAWVGENEASFDLNEPKIPLSPLDLNRLKTDKSK